MSKRSAMRRSGLTYSVKDSRNNEIAKGTANLNAFGAFDFKFKLPDNANLGYGADRICDEHQSARQQLRASISDSGISPTGI